MALAFRCLALEVISTYTLNESFPALQSPKFEHPFLISIQKSIPAFWIFRWLPYFLTNAIMNPSARALALEEYISGRSGIEDKNDNPQSVIGGAMMMTRMILKKLDKVTADPNWSTLDDSNTIFKFGSLKNVSFLL